MSFESRIPADRPNEPVEYSFLDIKFRVFEQGRIVDCSADEELILCNEENSNDIITSVKLGCQGSEGLESLNTSYVGAVVIDAEAVDYRTFRNMLRSETTYAEEDTLDTGFTGDTVRVIKPTGSQFLINTVYHKDKKRIAVLLSNAIDFDDEENNETVSVQASLREDEAGEDVLAAQLDLMMRVQDAALMVAVPTENNQKNILRSRDYHLVPGPGHISDVLCYVGADELEFEQLIRANFTYSDTFEAGGINTVPGLHPKTKGVLHALKAELEVPRGEGGRGVVIFDNDFHRSELIAASFAISAEVPVQNYFSIMGRDLLGKNTQETAEKIRIVKEKIEEAEGNAVLVIENIQSAVSVGSKKRRRSARPFRAAIKDLLDSKPDLVIFGLANVDEPLAPSLTEKGVFDTKLPTVDLRINDYREIVVAELGRAILSGFFQESEGFYLSRCSKRSVTRLAKAALANGLSATEVLDAVQDAQIEAYFDGETSDGGRVVRPDDIRSAMIRVKSQNPAKD